MAQKVELCLNSGCYTEEGDDGDATIISTAKGQSLSNLILEDISIWPPRVMCVQLCNVYMAAPYLQNTRQPSLSHHPSFEIARQASRPSFLISWAEYHRDHDWVVTVRGDRRSKDHLSLSCIRVSFE